MLSRREFRAVLALVLACLIACPPARALVTFNDSHDHIYVTGTIGVSHDSNVFASNGGKGDYILNSGLTAEYSRRAGWIGVNGSIAVNAAKFGKLSTEDFANPTLSLEFTKQTGRTKGSLTLNAARESRADAAINTRSTSWNYGAGLGLRYPINGNNDLAANLGWGQTKYVDNSAYANLSTYTTSLDAFHVFSSERDLLIGYRYRYGETSHNTSYTDNSISTGVSGRLMRGINGALRVGYQTRTPHGATPDHHMFSSWTASATASYAVSKKTSFTGTLSKDFSTTATDASVDALSAALDGQYAYSSHWNVSAGVTWGNSKFLGQGGRVVLAAGPPVVLGPQRNDSYFTANSSVGYSLNEHLKLSFGYMWFINWSTSSFADFVRSSWNMSASTHW
jgi:outer membrane receptor protein involved in Fe transport